MKFDVYSSLPDPLSDVERVSSRKGIPYQDHDVSSDPLAYVSVFTQILKPKYFKVRCSLLPDVYLAIGTNAQSRLPFLL